MATMTATFIKPGSDHPGVGKVYHHPTLTASKSSSMAYPSSNSSSKASSKFPYLAYKSPESLYGDSKEAAAFLALHQSTNLILRSSSLYDNSNYARTSASGSASPFSSTKNSAFAHPDFDASMLLGQQKQNQIKSTVIPIPSASNNNNSNQQLPRVEVAKVSTTAKPKNSSSFSSSSSSEEGENYVHCRGGGNNNRSTSLVDRLSTDEHQALSRLLYKHFANSRVSSSGIKTSEAPVPADYDEEDPRTWPSNWLAQVPTMILQPETYLASKPLLNAYQRQLIRRLSSKYEPLVVHYLQQLVALRSSSSEEVVRKFNGSNGESSFFGANSLQQNSSASSRSSGAKKQQQPLLVKSASHASALSQSNSVANNNSSQQQHYQQQQQMNNSFDLGNFCHKEALELNNNSRRSISSAVADLRPSPSLDSSALSSNSSSNSSSMSSSRSNSSLSTTSSSPPPSQTTPQKAAPVQAPVEVTRENRLARLSQQMANKWSNKMKIYLRKN